MLEVAGALLLCAGFVESYRLFFLERSLCNDLMRGHSEKEWDREVSRSNAHSILESDGSHEIVEETRRGTFACTIEISGGHVTSISYALIAKGRKRPVTETVE